MKRRESGTLYLVVIDGFGVGAQEDAGEYGDREANTLLHVSRETGCRLPNLARLGLGNILPLPSVPPDPAPLGGWGKMREVSPGKDSTTGHWEIAGIQLEKPFPVFSEGFPPEVVDSFCQIAGCDRVLCNRPWSGTEAIEDFGRLHLETGRPIVYTSSDSVFQVACHRDVTPPEQLYDWCRTAREEIMTGEFAVGRVIARPFAGSPGNFHRLNGLRHDFSLEPPQPNLPDYLRENGIRTFSAGKIVDLFTEKTFDRFHRTRNNAEGLSRLLSLMAARPGGFVFVNLIDTDQVYGHRQDPAGYARSLEEIDRAVPAMMKRLGEGDLLIITSDHGNDPADESTDHTREFVPLLAAGRGVPPGCDLGTRSTFSDVAASACDFFRLENPFPGTSFL